MVWGTRIESLKFQQSLSEIMTIEMREFQLSDTECIEEMILKAENFGITFLDHEMLRINVHTNFPQFGRILVAFAPENGETMRPTRTARIVVMAGPMLGTSSRRPATIAKGTAYSRPKKAKPA